MKAVARWLFILLLPAVSVRGQLVDKPARLKFSESYFGNSWRFRAGDSVAWANPDFNDRNWLQVNPEVSLPGAQPLVSSCLANYLQTDADELIHVEGDEFDRLMAAEGLCINRFVFFRDLDLLLLILTNRRIISRRLSAYSFLQNASDQQLADYVLSTNGIHWPALDADLSLRGFLLEEAVLNFRASASSLADLSA